ncbi:oocyte zinc finger protein XlCOF6-like [Liolophura sinensis]|uniref:oocyte zinc finger protein XlCOF6-like n=1 Tax=Liolophura sinensis TaxID=3198878 RepID=UPI00315810D5
MSSESKQKIEKGTNVDDSLLSTSRESLVKPRRTRGRPRKTIQENSNDQVPHVTDVDKLIEAIATTKVEIKSQKESEKCYLCGLNIEPQAQNQEAIPHPENKDTCSACGSVVPVKRKRRRKAVKTSDTEEFLCSVCGVNFVCKQDLSNHQSSTHPDHNKEERFDDSENINTSDPDWRVSKRRKRLRSKKVKSSSHDTGESPKKRGRKRLNNMIPGKTACDVCGANLSNESALEVHMRKHSGEKPFSCKECGKSFTTKCNMQRHEKTHSGAKPYKCEECNKWFTEKKSVKVHMRSHTGEKPYKCKICDRSFAQTGILQSHMDLHTGHKGHLCDYCGKAFRQKCQLRMHQKRHFDKRSYKCEHCGACFVTKGDMDRHRLKHTGERPFLCTHCPKSFTRMQYLREHVNQHTGTKPYTCKVCSSSFHDLSTYHRHLRKHKLEAERKVAVLYSGGESEQEKSEITTVYFSSEVDVGSQFDSTNTSVHSHMPLSHSLLTQNSSGGFELACIPQRMLDEATGQAKEVRNVTQVEDSLAGVGDTGDLGNVTVVVKGDQGSAKSDVTTLLLSPEDLNHLQGGRQASEIGLTNVREQVEDASSLQHIKVTDISQLPPSMQNTQLITATNNGQTSYHLAYVESGTHYVITEDDISAMNLLASASNQQLSTQALE